MDVCFVVSLTTLIIIWHDCVFVNTFFEKILFSDFALFLIRIFVDFSVVELPEKKLTNSHKNNIFKVKDILRTKS